MAKPFTTLTEEQITELGALSAVLNTIQIADYFGMCHVTFKALRDRDDRVNFAYKNGKARAIANIAGNLIKSAKDGNTSAQIFYLKTQAGWRETDTPKDDESLPLNITFQVKDARADITVTKGQ